MTATTIFEVNGYKLDRFIDGDQIVKDTQLNMLDLNDGFLNQAGLAAYYGMMSARALGQAASMKLRRDVVTAKISQQLRGEADSNSKAKLTEAALAEKVDKDPRVQAIREAYNQSCVIEAELKAAVDAIKNRRDMLIQLGAHAREEMKGTLRMSMTPGVSDRGAELKAKLAKARA